MYEEVDLGVGLQVAMRVPKDNKEELRALLEKCASTTLSSKVKRGLYLEKTEETGAHLVLARWCRCSAGSSASWWWTLS